MIIMSKKRSKEFREMGVEELKNKIKELKANYSKDIVKLKTGAHENKAIKLSNERRKVARALTILNEKENPKIQPKEISKSKKVVEKKEVVKKVKEVKKEKNK